MDKSPQKGTAQEIDEDDCQEYTSLSSTTVGSYIIFRSLKHLYYQWKIVVTMFRKSLVHHFFSPLVFVLV